jgi:DNA-binding MarR family transcriptional regulator
MSNKKSNRREIIAKIVELLREQSTQTVLFHAVIAEQFGLHTTDHKALDIIVKSGKMTAGQLAEMMRLTTGAVTGVIDRLEKAGFVRRALDLSDRRRILVELVPDTLERMAPVFAPIQKQTENLLEKYSGEELAVIADFVEQCVELAKGFKTIFGK